MTDALWTAVIIQILLGAFDTLYHHEGTERLAWRPGQQVELRLHGVRNLLYAVLFAALGFSEPHGAWAAALLGLLAVELGITLWDFVEEDRTRDLPASERVTHALVTLNYGVILAMLVPWLWGNAARATALLPAFHGLMSGICALAVFGVMLFGLRDLEAAGRCRRLRTTPAAQLAATLPGRRTILVTGGTGFVGRRLVAALAEAGHEVIVLSRKAAKTDRPGAVRTIPTLDAVADRQTIDGIVNLAGEPISNGLWTLAKRRRILASRLRVTHQVVRLIARLERKPEVLVSGSAIGWYGLRGDELLGEGGDGRACFSRRLCVAWERQAQRAETLGLRVVRLRTGLVFDRDGGLLARLLLPFEFGLVGRIGHGRQWMSWIHRDDLVRLIVHCLATPALKGPVNATAPCPATNAQVTAALAHALHRPVVLPLPAAPLRLALGDFAEELLLGGQRVVPAAALATGFTFTYPELDTALAAICGAKPRARHAPRKAPPACVRPVALGSMLR